MNEIILDIKNLEIYLYTRGRVLKPIDKINLRIRNGETKGLIGESGCGKTLTALSILDLIPKSTGNKVTGDILFNGENIINKSFSEMRKIRGKQISMIFQEPMSSMNPLFTIGDQIIETILIHNNISKKEAYKRALQMLKRVDFSLPDEIYRKFPHQLSGGMIQRAMIAMALSCNPKLLIADEPTTALDVTIQAEILELVKKLKRDLNMSLLIISHDLGVVAELSNEIYIMYLGNIVEQGSTEQIFTNPLHPYTKELIKLLPSMADRCKKRLKPIKGNVPNILNIPSGCKFHPRCKLAKDICSKENPPLLEKETNHFVRCWLYM